MTIQHNQLQKRIMRRVYYTFARNIATHTITLQLSVLALALFVVAKTVFVQRVIDNMIATEIQNLPGFITGAFLHGEVLTLMAVGAIAFTLLSLPRQVVTQLLPSMQRTFA